ncbi:hypothetical protein [Bacillus testis]|nr:hypothetical protein [Bacillus testis]
MLMLLLVVMLFIILLGLAEVTSMKKELIAVRKLLEKQENKN